MKYNVLDFIFGGLSAAGATIITNPLEVIKVRMQLQGELSAKGTYAKPYKNVFSSFATIWKQEGILGLQKGLVPALNYQLIMNGIRLGIYNTALRENRMNNSVGEKSLLKSFLWGAFGCVVGAVTTNPLFLVKIQLQSQSSKASKATAVGYQHSHTSMTNALKTVYLEHGLLGLWRGCLANSLLLGIGSGIQLGTYTLVKELLIKHNLVIGENLNSLTSAALGGTLKTILIIPVDVITTRVFNQPVDKNGSGIVYRGLIDCGFKILKLEGVQGFYKGFWASYIRVVPHGITTLFIFDKLVALQS